MALELPKMGQAGGAQGVGMNSKLGGSQKSGDAAKTKKQDVFTQNKNQKAQDKKAAGKPGQSGQKMQLGKAGGDAGVANAGGAKSNGAAGVGAADKAGGAQANSKLGGAQAGNTNNKDAYKAGAEDMAKKLQGQGEQNGMQGKKLNMQA